MADPEKGGEQGAKPDAAPEQQTPTTPTPTPEEIKAQAVSEAKRAFEAQIEELTGHKSIEAAKAAKAKAEADKLAAEGKYAEAMQAAEARAQAAEERYRTAQVKAALLGASGEAVDPELVHELLASHGSVAEDGAVSIGGKPAAAAVAELLKAKPYLAKPAGGQGSGSEAGKPAGAKEPPKRADYPDDISYHKARAQYAAGK